MAQCKKENCRSEAVPFGKRYCPFHKAEYERKNREYLAMQATLRRCDKCDLPLTKNSHDRGDTTCMACEVAFEIEIIKHREWEKFKMAKSVDDLKKWMEEFLIPKMEKL